MSWQRRNVKSSKCDLQDLTALRLEEAQRRLAEVGLPARIVETRPPDRTLIGPLRVIAVRRRAGEVVLVVGRSGPLPRGEAAS